MSHMMRQQTEHKIGSINAVQRGSAAVEFAIILPVLAVLLFSIVEFGLIFYNKAVITNASREGARFGILYRQPGSEVTCGQIDAIINAYTAGNLVTFGAATGVTINYTPANCTPATGSELTVNVSYPYDYLVLPRIVEDLAGRLTLVGQTIMVRE